MADDTRPDTDPRWKLTPTKYAVAAILLFATVVPLLVSTYDRVEPRLFGFPFFYWYQLIWVFIAALCCAAAFYLLQRERRAWERDHPRPGSSDTSTGERGSR
ncbi:DUF3311 domain-containing protein [Microlunatus panaciterrae]|uniref:Na+/proline symporter n=1 Tax=Microlunatus panaciterrae TaxID=400768 RepID=A0ABS2REJ9_9ACTN|nr:DUF3311 domain-containing protein [Microlunatus panaciterrae]MBM7797429.1 Na+/proline symporter [Microlunatus panaciterrae]